ncbi:ABC transporter permease [Oceanirhabdus sp. W0125-5]|uniref:ABC transporter permease n=1 Tax=Oceanirhabdus sp. W0125-5 TaxID=2999116 RepID=UPI0022F2B850|nr:ABC transporter permease [Oceanirhabdus sp. W0125-5]WBW97064.1 ABC transporter permease [Oceanirhabdus sp. W0125-5]
MKVLRISLIYFKRMIKDPKTIAFSFLMPLVLLIGISFDFGGKSSPDIEAAYSVNDEGTYASEILKELNINKYVFYNEDEKAMELLENNDVVVVYRIPKEFTEEIKNGVKPIIKSFKREEGNSTLLFEMNISDKVNKRIREELLLKKDIIEDKEELSKGIIKSEVKPYKRRVGKNLFLATMLIIYFIILSSSGIGTEILNLKKHRILSRAVTTPNKGYEVIGSIYLAMLLQQIVIYTLILVLGKFILGYSLMNFHIALINIILTSMFSISLGVFITRIINEPTVASLITILICIVTFFISLIALASDMLTNIPWILINLAKFTPQYWALTSLENSQLFPNVFVLLLMALALFTAGNYKLRDYVNK